MKIIISSRSAIEERAKRPFDKNTAIISITDCDKEFPTLYRPPDFLLRERFDDISEGAVCAMLKRKPTEEERRLLRSSFRFITPEQAREIADFYKSIREKADILICQCEYGESRSAACAAAILEYEQERGNDIFSDERYSPNDLVYSAVLEALRKF